MTDTAQTINLRAARVGMVQDGVMLLLSQLFLICKVGERRKLRTKK